MDSCTSITSSSVTKFCIKGQNLYIKLDWKENEVDLFHIKIYDGTSCWSGRYSNQFAAKYRDIVEETDEEYNKNVKLGLSNQNDDLFVIVFNVNPDTPSTGTFTWKKKLDEAGLLVHGSVPVHQDYSESKDAIIDFLIQENRDLKHIAEESNMKIQILESELHQCKTELEKFVNLKTSLEMSVYGKFVQLLNSKKRRLKILDPSFDEQGDSNMQDNELD